MGTIHCWIGHGCQEDYFDHDEFEKSVCQGGTFNEGDGLETQEDVFGGQG
jgi:hypothetical protein